MKMNIFLSISALSAAAVAAQIVASFEGPGAFHRPPTNRPTSGNALATSGQPATASPHSITIANSDDDHSAWVY